MKQTINYFYFGFFFLVITLLHCHHLFQIHHGDIAAHLLFSVDVIIQCFLEALLLCFIANLIEHYFPKGLYKIFLISTFILFLCHIIEFPFLRLMDVSIWYGLDFIFDESWENFIEILKSSSVSLKAWFIGALFAMGLFLFGFWLCHITDRLSKKKPLYLTWGRLTKIGCFGFLFLLAWDTGVSYFVEPYYDDRLEKALPWKQRMIGSSRKILTLDHPLKPFDKKKISNPDYSAIHTPDIFLFVVESLREDFLTEETSPHLYQFKTQYNNENLTFSNSNATQISWFSLFHSQFPFNWQNVRKHSFNEGALPLQILKNMGYQIRVYSSSRLAFYQMNEFIFGKDLATSIEEFHTETDTPWQFDAHAFAKLQKDLQEHADPTLYIVFLESTHFDYSWPKDQTPFLPIVDKIDYLQTSLFKTDMDEIKNRYRNAIHYVDSLFGDFLNAVKVKENPVIVVTGDHGEEFFEDGHLFHASNLNEYQTRVPIYYNLNGLEKRITSHMDIFPTLLHYIGGEERFSEYFQGTSLFTHQESPFVVAGRYNASRNPCEFFIHNGRNKFQARFINSKAIYNCQKIDILSAHHPDFIQKEFHSSFNQLFGP